MEEESGMLGSWILLLYNSGLHEIQKSAEHKATSWRFVCFNGILVRDRYRVFISS